MFKIENKKTALIMDIIFSIPLLVINFFCYGIEGDINFIKEIKMGLDKTNPI